MMKPKVQTRFFHLKKCNNVSRHFINWSIILFRCCYSTCLTFNAIGDCLNILLLLRKQFRTSSYYICKLFLRLQTNYIFSCFPTDLLLMSVAALLLIIWVNGLYLYVLDLESNQQFYLNSKFQCSWIMFIDW